MVFGVRIVRVKGGEGGAWDDGDGDDDESFDSAASSEVFALELKGVSKKLLL